MPCRCKVPQPEPMRGIVQVCDSCDSCKADSTVRLCAFIVPTLEEGRYYKNSFVYVEEDNSVYYIDSDRSEIPFGSRPVFIDDFDPKAAGVNYKNTTIYDVKNQVSYVYGPDGQYITASLASNVILEGEGITINKTSDGQVISADFEVVATINALGEVESKLNDKITEVDQKVDEEAENRLQSEIEINQRIDQEVGDLQRADDELSAKLEQETTNREQAEETLGQRIDDVASSVEAETSARQEADSVLSSTIESAKAELQQAIDGETDARTSADSALQQAIDTETQARSEAISNIESQLGTSGEELSTVTGQVATIENAIDTVVMTDLELAPNASTTVVQLDTAQKNLKTGASVEKNIPLPVANENQAGVMNAATFKALQQNNEITKALLNGAVAINGLPESPSQEELTEQWKEATKLDELINRAQIRDTTNGKTWTYYTNDSTWHASSSEGGSVEINQATNTSLGTVKGSTRPGQNFVENDGSLSLNGWDESQTRLDNIESKLGTVEVGAQKNAPLYSETGTNTDGAMTQSAATTAINSVKNSIPTIANATGTSTTSGISQSAATTALNGKQATLVSGTNIKTVNGTSLLGSGNIATPSGTITGVSANGTSVATSGVANIPAASTSAYGVTQLSDATNSTSTALAATANAVKKAYDLANGKGTGTITAVQANGTSVATSGTANIPAATTSKYGVTQLSSSHTSNSTTLAATASAVKDAYDRADAAYALASAGGKNVYFGNITTVTSISSGESAKVVATCDGFTSSQLVAGTVVYLTYGASSKTVRIRPGSSAATTLAVGSATAKNIKIDAPSWATSKSVKYARIVPREGEVIQFVYDGTNWLYVGPYVWSLNVSGGITTGNQGNISAELSGDVLTVACNLKTKALAKNAEIARIDISFDIAALGGNSFDFPFITYNATSGDIALAVGEVSYSGSSSSGAVYSPIVIKTLKAVAEDLYVCFNLALTL